jgi:hypothetical protein
MCIRVRGLDMAYDRRGVRAFVARACVFSRRVAAWKLKPRSKPLCAIESHFLYKGKNDDEENEGT